MRPATTAPCSARTVGERVRVRSSLRLRVTDAILSALIRMAASCLQGKDLLHAIELGEAGCLGTGPEAIGLAITRHLRIHERMGGAHAVHAEGAGIERELHLPGDVLLAGFQESFQVAGQGIEEMPLMQQLAVEVAER